MPVHACAAIVEQDRAGAPGAGCAVNGPPDRWRQRYQDHLPAFAADSQHPVTVFRASCFDTAPAPINGKALSPRHAANEDDLCLVYDLSSTWLSSSP